MEGTRSLVECSLTPPGFPDSFVLWRHLLQSSSLQSDNILIAVDLPGYGGSDGLTAYGPDEVLGTLTEFVIGVREQFLQDGKKAVIITHDWGAVIGARLAAEAHVLADHWIITGGIVPGLQRSNGKNRILLAKQMLRTWIRSPLNFGLLKNGLSALGPVAAQFRRSFYIFVFHLPPPFNNLFATFGNYWFLRVLHEFGKGPRSKSNKTIITLNPIDAAEAMAISTGPGLAQLDKVDGHGEHYGESVRRRVKDRGMSEKIRIYRENLIFGKWEKTLETTAALFNISSDAASARSSSSGGALSNTAPQGALRAPATIILGEKDPAFDRRLALDNARDFLVKGSQVVIIKGAGHW
jgi:pimeloyl-ACP methyl ester carboxylesterase